MPSERRLHPLSWLFVLLAQLKSLLLPLGVLAFGSARSSGRVDDLIGVGVAALLVLWSVVKYAVYRWQIAGDGLVIRDGILQRSVRHIPFARIHNVVLQQNLLQRWVGVAEIRLESAGGVKPEAQMQVLSLADARALEALVRRGAAGADALVQAPGLPGVPADAAARPSAQETVLLALSAGEVLRAGLTLKRGQVVLLSGLALVSQMGSDLLAKNVERAVRAVAANLEALWLGGTGGQPVGPAVLAAGAAALAVAALGLMLLLSVVVAVLRFHGFTLTQAGQRLRLQSGLLNRVRSSLPRHRIQGLRLEEGLLHHWMERRVLSADTASGQLGNPGAESSTYLAPVATPAFIDDLIRRLMPGAMWPVPYWHALHPMAWLRVAVWPVLLMVLVCGGLSLRWGAVAWWGLVFLPLLVWRAHILAAQAGWSWDGRLLATQQGWLSRHWHLVEADKLQTVVWSQGVVDRWLGMASVLADTAGGAGQPALRIRYLRADDARRLKASLAAAAARGRSAAQV
jgi:putative membrane protein